MNWPDNPARWKYKYNKQLLIFSLMCEPMAIYGALYLFITALCRELFFRIFYQCMYQHIDSA